MRGAFGLRHWLLLALTLFLAWVVQRQVGWVPLLFAAVLLAWPMRGRADGRAVLAVLGLLLATWILLQLKWVVYPLVGGILLAAWLDPWVTRLSRRMPRAMAASIALLPIGVVLALVVLVLVPTVANEVQVLISKLPDAIRLVRDWLTPMVARLSPNGADPNFGLPGLLAQAPEEILARLEKLLHPALEGAAGLGRGVGRAAQLLGALLLTPILGQYLLVEWPRIVREVDELMPERWRPRSRRVGAVSISVLRTYLRGQLLVAGIEAVLYAIGFALGGVPEAIALGILAGFFSLVPVLGFWITALVAVLSALIAPSPLGALLGVTIVLTVVQVLENQLLVPKIQGSGLGLHPLAVLLGVIGLGVLFGVLGALFAVPLLGIIAALWPEIRASYTASRFFRGEEA